MVDDGRPSVFVVVLRPSIMAPYFCSILQFQSPSGDDSPPSSPPPPPSGDDSSPDQAVEESEPLPSWPGLTDRKEYVAHLATLQVPGPRVLVPVSGPRPGPEIRCLAAPIPPTRVPPGTRWMFSTTPEGLCMVPFLTCSTYLDVNQPLPLLEGRLFNVCTKSFQKMCPSSNFNPHVGCAVNLGGCIYFMPHPYALGRRGYAPRFERYVSSRDLWETLAPFPVPSGSSIQATIALYDTILFKMVGIRRECKIWAYNVTLDKWFPVTVLNKLCYRIVGEAVVLEDTIFALKDRSYNSVLALSVQRLDFSDGKIEYTCSLVCEILVRGLERIPSRCGREVMETRSLVHLGEGKFCLVQSCELECCPVYSQTIQLSYMNLVMGHKSMIVTHNLFHEVPIVDSLQFQVAFCFSMPECKTTPPSIQPHKFFDINPFPKDFDLERFNLRNRFSDPCTEYPLLKDSFASTSSVYPAPKRLKTGGEDFEQGGSKTASDRGETVGEGPENQIRLSHRERGNLIRSWLEKYQPHAMQSYSLSEEASLPEEVSMTGDPEESSASERGETVGEGPENRVPLSNGERGEMIRRWCEKYLPHVM